MSLRFATGELTDRCGISPAAARPHERPVASGPELLNAGLRDGRTRIDPSDSQRDLRYAVCAQLMANGVSCVH